MSFETRKYGRYPIHFAARSGMPGTITALIKYGANIESLNNRRNSQTPLHQAASSNSLEIVAELLDLGANIEARDK